MKTLSQDIILKSKTKETIEYKLSDILREKRAFLSDIRNNSELRSKIEKICEQKGVSFQSFILMLSQNQLKNEEKLKEQLNIIQGALKEGYFIWKKLLCSKKCRVCMF